MQLCHAIIVYSILSTIIVHVHVIGTALSYNYTCLFPLPNPFFHMFVGTLILA